MAAATVKKLWDYNKEGLTLSDTQVPMLLAGNVIAFVVALIAIRSFLSYVQKHSFRAFGAYRIVAGGTVILLLSMGIIKKADHPMEPTKPIPTISIMK